MKKKMDSSFRTVRGYQLVNQQEKELTPAMEDYLEMGYRLCQTHGYTRVGKISEILHVKPSSASKMVTRLRELGYLEYDSHDSIRLTPKGQELGEYLLERHQIVEDFLQLIGSPNSLIEAELVEHSLSPETVSRLKLLLEFFNQDSESKKRLEAYKEKNEEKEKRPS
jgi:DtxR family Mn-dependent transcriptional regulator